MDRRTGVERAAAAAHLGTFVRRLNVVGGLARPLPVWIYDRGIVVGRSAESHTVFPWHLCRVAYAPDNPDGGPPRADAVHTADFLIERCDGEEFRASASGAAEMGEILVRALHGTAVARVPEHVAALADGVGIDFGSVRVDRVGIALRGRKVPWDQVASVRLVDLALEVRRQGDPAVHAVPVAAVLDLHVLLRVIALLPGSAVRRPAPTPVAAARRHADQIVAQGQFGPEVIDWTTTDTLGAVPVLRPRAEEWMDEEGVGLIGDAVRAHHLTEGRHYSIHSERIVLLDVRTGEGRFPVERRWGGLLQALEARRGLPIRSCPDDGRPDPFSGRLDG